METVHIVTAISRPDKLPTICESLIDATRSAKFLRFVWHWRFDIERSGIDYANKIKNEMLDDISDGWVWILDDDTIVHPMMFLEFESQVSDDIDAFVMHQLRSDGMILVGCPENNRVNHIDSNQAIIRRSAIDNVRMSSDYNADGQFLETVLAKCRIHYANKVLCFHNALS